MTNREAIERAMDALAAKDTVTVERRKAKPRSFTGKDKDKSAALAAADAEAWNMLSHLAKVL